MTRLAKQVGLSRLPFGVVGLAGVGGHRVAAGPQEAGHLLGGGDGEGVDDAGARQLVQVVGQPGPAMRRRGQLEDAEAQARSIKAAAQHERAAGAELLGDVSGHPCVGRRRGREHGRALGQARQQTADAPVVGSEVVAPVRDAVSLVDDDQTGTRGEAGENRVAEVGVVQPLGAHQQDVDLPGRNLCPYDVPLVDVGRVDRATHDAGPAGGLHLVAHQGKQRRHDHRGTRAAGPQQRGRDEVDRRLAPPGALDDQGRTALDHEGPYRGPLVLAQRRARAGQRLQQRLGLGPQGSLVDGGGQVGRGNWHA